MNALIIDIETTGEEWKDIDQQTKDVLVNRVTRWHPELEAEAETLAQNDLGFSPFTGEIIAIGLLDADTAKGAVYFQAPNKKVATQEKDGIKLQSRTEKEMLEQFWLLAERYSHFVTFSGRAFDIPFIMLRSAVHGVKPTKDLMRGRYLYQSAPNAVHVDLYDQLSFYGAMNRLGGLHLACRAFGIKTPKDGAIDGAAVPEFYKQKKYQEIAEYNARDLIATRELYQKWQRLLSFS